LSICIISAVSLCLAQPPKEPGPVLPSVPAAEGSEFVVEQPGTITFKTGIVIVGKVEKPQVIIFLPKEKSYYREIKFSRSFIREIEEPMPFEPVIE
jgi:hypothetical protein